jgi:cytochrome c oxidase subunit 3
MSMAMTTGGYNRSRIHPKKFTLLVACASMVMMFAAFTSAYIVRKAAGNWLEFELPNVFYISTAVLILSSLLLHGSYIAFMRRNPTLYKGLMIVAAVAGFGFILLQWEGWQAMQAIGAGLRTNPSSSFVYVISGVHAAHVLGGIAVLAVALIHAFGLPYKLTRRRKLRFEMTLIYWHFVDLLWIYLLVFFVMQQS